MTSARRRGSSAWCSRSSSPARSPPRSSGSTCGPGGDPPARQAGQYVRGRLVLVLLASMALLGGLRALLGNGPQFARLRRGIAGRRLRAVVVHRLVHAHGPGEMAGPHPYGCDHGRRDGGLHALRHVWMPRRVTRNETQFGFFGVALALVTWFSGAAICVLVGACAGPVFAADPGSVGRFVRGGDDADAHARRGPSPAAAGARTHAARRFPTRRRGVDGPAASRGDGDKPRPPALDTTDGKRETRERRYPTSRGWWYR